MLAHLLIKGLKGNFDKVYDFMSSLIEDNDYISG